MLYKIKSIYARNINIITRLNYQINHQLINMVLGARKWQVSLDFDEGAFQSAIYKIYPRLTSVPGYTLWNIKKDKTFEKLPIKVSRIVLYEVQRFS